MKRNKENSRKARKLSSHVILLNCMVAHMTAFGYTLEWSDNYTGSTAFRHDDGSRIEFKNVRELIRFEREASHRKIY